jgi:hypothetical protein
MGVPVVGFPSIGVAAGGRLLPCPAGTATLSPSPRSVNVSCSERKKEIKRRRHRQKKFGIFARKLKTATVSERAVIAEKLRGLTPGCNELIARWELEKKR